MTKETLANAVALEQRFQRFVRGRPVREQVQIVSWLEHVALAAELDPESVMAGILAGLLDGTVEIESLGASGEVRVQLTEAGKAAAQAAVLGQLEERRFYQAFLGVVVVDGPTGVQ
jgi:hypothetical protein